jgi:deoxyadenosine/deoxycytidine kinase
MNDEALIAVVGPCKSGKSTLVNGLLQKGYRARQVAQEHSFSPSMWQRITKPDVLVYLHSEHETAVSRGLNWLERDHAEQQTRLLHAREHADIEIATDDLEAAKVLAQIVDFLEKAGI